MPQRSLDDDSAFARIVVRDAEDGRVRFEAEDRGRLAELTDAIGTLHIGSPSILVAIAPATRELLEVDDVMSYCPSEHVEGWGFRHVHFTGSSRFVDGLGDYLGSAPHRFAFYNPTRPEAHQRNRTIEAIAMVNRTEPGGFEATPIYQKVFAPLKMERLRQLRTLICDGPSLLTWFGGLQDRAVTVRQHRLLSALIRPLQRRLSVERRLADGGLATAALEAAIEHTGSPSFVVSRTGRLLAANASGRELLEQDRATTRELLALAARGRAHASFELVPLREPGTAAAWLVLMRVSTAEQSIARCEATAAERWTLTPRQRSVLKLLIGGDSNARIAASLGIGERAVELHVTALLDRAGLDGRAALVACVLSMRR